MKEASESEGSDDGYYDDEEGVASRGLFLKEGEDGGLDLDDTEVAKRYMDFGCDFRKEPSQRVVRQALLARRPFWSGNFCWDYSFHVANNHPVLSIFTCSPIHPYSKVERLLVILISSAITITATVCFNGAIRTLNRHFEWCDLEAYRWLPVFVFITLPVMLLELILGQFAVLDVYFRRDETDTGCLVCMCNCVANQCLKAELYVFTCGLVIAIIPMALCLVYVESSGDPAEVHSMTRIFWSARLNSWTLWFVTDLFMPCCGFIHAWWTFREEWKTRMEEKEANNEMGEVVSRESSSDDDTHGHNRAHCDHVHEGLLVKMRNQCICAFVLLSVVLGFTAFVNLQTNGQLEKQVVETLGNHTNLTAINFTGINSIPHNSLA